VPDELQDPRLDENWRVVVIATTPNFDLLRKTLSDIEANSVSHDISILAVADNMLAECADELGYPIKESLPAVINPDSFWVTVLAALGFAIQKTVFLRAGVRVPHHWDARLAAAGQRNQLAAAISPVCARHPLLSAFTDPSHEPSLTVGEVDQWLNDYVDGKTYVVPVVLESCVILQGELWSQLGDFDNDQQLLEALRLRGAWLLATDQLYIDDTGVDCLADLTHLPAAFTSAYRERHPLTRTRSAMTELSGRGEKPAVRRTCLPVQLHVGHSWGGGLGRWIEDYIGADTSHHNLVLRSIGDLSGFGQTIALYTSTRMKEPVRRWVLSEPILSTALSHYDYQSLIRELISEFSVESLMISSLIGHSLDLLRTGLDTRYVFHDFSPFCPALYATFGEGCRRCNAMDLQACSRANPLHSFFKFESDAHWLSIREAFIDLVCDTRTIAIAPSASVVERYRQLEPALRDKSFSIIEHGLDQQLAESLIPARRTGPEVLGNRLKIVVLSSLTTVKGGDLLKEIIDDIAEFADIWLLGVGESESRFQNARHTTIIRDYKKTELGIHLQEIDADLGLLMSVVPETFSYTLSELWAAGVPVLATRLGAFQDRITDSINGWLVEAEGGLILDKIQQIDRDRQSLAATRAILQQQPVRTAATMVSEYNALELEPQSVPLARYNLPRRSHHNPYLNRTQDVQIPRVRPQVTYRSALIEFLSYTCGKLEQTPQLPKPITGLFLKIVRTWIKWLSR
jgi:glycosyltransferase involved in cell wall biosynthesis